MDPALIAALNNMQLHGTDWHMDIGTSHMASDLGNFQTRFPCSSQSVTGTFLSLMLAPKPSTLPLNTFIFATFS
jgi:hypothetical protein